MKKAEMAAGPVSDCVAVSAPDSFAGLHSAIVMRRRRADRRGGFVSDKGRFDYTGSSVMKNNRELSLQLQRSWRVVRYRLAELIRGQ